MAGQLQQLQPSDKLLLGHVHPHHDQEVEPERSPQPQAGEAEGDEAGPVQQRGAFDQSHAELRLTRWHTSDPLPVEGPGLA